MLGYPLKRLPHAAMISAWLDANGGARRFEEGETADGERIRKELREAGYRIHRRAGSWFVGRGHGRPKKMPWAGVIALWDELRAARGLPPLLPPAKMKAHR